MTAQELSDVAAINGHAEQAILEHGPKYRAAELKRAQQHIERLTAELHEQRTAAIAVAVERDYLRHDKTHLEYILEQYKQRVEMAAVCLEHDPPEPEQALAVLEEKDLRRECEDCGGPCYVEGDTCLLCGHKQPVVTDHDVCPKREGE